MTALRLILFLAALALLPLGCATNSTGGLTAQKYVSIQRDAAVGLTPASQLATRSNATNARFPR